MRISQALQVRSTSVDVLRELQMNCALVVLAKYAEYRPTIVVTPDPDSAYLIPPGRVKACNSLEQNLK